MERGVPIGEKEMKIYRTSKFDKLCEQVVNEIEKIKQHLYTSEDFENYNEFVDNQSMGDCQSIVSDIKRNFPNTNAIFGEIEIDDPYVDEYGDEQNFVTHHWIELNGIPYDFSKGSLKAYIQFDSIYDPEIMPNEEYRYNPIHKK